MNTFVTSRRCFALMDSVATLGLTKPQTGTGKMGKMFTPQATAARLPGLIICFTVALFSLSQGHVLADTSGNTGTFVHLFEWKWPAVARECEDFLGPNGFTAVQVSPPQEHVPGEQWWTRYQPVSYQLESRGGTRAEFKKMVTRCKSAGVDIYVDAVINHMSGVGEGVGVAGTKYGRYQYPVPYVYDDFHHCGRHGDDDIQNYQDAWEVRNCELVNLTDLVTESESVREQLAGYLADLVDIGVAGFRIDAAKHMEPADIEAILNRVPEGSFVFQEVIDRGNEPITGEEYVSNGSVTEFKYGIELVNAFNSGDLSGLQHLGSGKGFLDSGQAIIFVDNHDIQRGHAGAGHTLTHKQGKLYELANVFMLAWPYGYPKVMSSYHFDDFDQGPPSNPPIDINGVCADGWECEHRNPAIASMVGFRKQTVGQPVRDWTQPDTSVIAFSRGDKGLVAINTGASIADAQFSTGLAPGQYCNIIAAGNTSVCPDNAITIAADGTVSISLPPMSAVAIHTGAVRP
jgi:alpha-amylase